MRVFRVIFAIILIIFVIISSIFVFSFKIAYKDIVVLEAQNNQLRPALVFSIIKAESKFNCGAKSSAGAVGLMQIKLDTANYILKLNGEEKINESDLLNPAINIKIGTLYLRYLQNKFENLDVVICAYNAGETVVRNWLENIVLSKDGKTLIYVPFKETKTYLKKVKFNLLIYSKIL